MDKYVQLDGLRNLRSCLARLRTATMKDHDATISDTIAAVGLETYIRLVDTCIAELTKDEPVALELTRGEWDRVMINMHGGCGALRNRIRSQLEAKANE